MTSFFQDYFFSIWKVMLSVFLAAIFLTLMVPGQALAATGGEVVARVTVSAYINFTILDYGDGGLKFGSLTPGSENNPEKDQMTIFNKEPQGAVEMQLGADSNVSCNIYTKASDFISGKDKLPVSNVSWNTSIETATATSMSDSYAYIITLNPGQIQKLWNWLSVPAKQAPGIYSADFYYQATRVS